MRLKRIINIVAFAGTILWATLSCEQAPCSDSDGVQMNAGFYKRTDGALKDTALTKMTPFILEAGDTIRIKEMFSSDKKMIFLPLSKTKDTSVFVFQFDSIQFDTLYFYHTKTLKLESHQCGFDFFYEITGSETTIQVIDSVWIRKANVGYGEQENVKIFF
jgi:hypothetical protein